MSLEQYGRCDRCGELDAVPEESSIPSHWLGFSLMIDRQAGGPVPSGPGHEVKNFHFCEQCCNDCNLKYDSAKFARYVEKLIKADFDASGRELVAPN